jgi:hypothetical protein
MTDNRCPVCGSKRFYVKHPEDEYDIHEFDCREGLPVFDPGAGDEPPDVCDDTRTYCNTCAWHGPFQELKKQ